MTFQENAREGLLHGNAEEKAGKLWVRRGSSSLPEDLLAAVRGLMEDRSVVRMYIPFKYGELRFLAAEVFARMQFILGRTEPFVLNDAIAPMKARKLEDLRAQAGLPRPDLRPIESFKELREMQVLPVADYHFDRRDFDLNS